MFAARDPLGFRPLAWSVQGRLFAAASESVALVNLGMADIRHVEPGQMLIVEGGRLRVERFARLRRRAHCFFEWVYFANVASRIDDSSVYLARARSGERDLYQQFSTPSHYGYAVAWLANIGPNDIVLEPSAGTGNLAVHAINAGAAQVAGNELSERRAALLRELGLDAVFTEDAEQIHNILAGRIRPTVMVMNPPFSRAAERMGAKRLVGTDPNSPHLDSLHALSPTSTAPGSGLFSRFAPVGFDAPPLSRRIANPNAASTNPKNSGCGLPGRERNSGWNWQLRNQG